MNRFYTIILLALLLSSSIFVGCASDDGSDNEHDLMPIFKNSNPEAMVSTGFKLITGVEIVPDGYHGRTFSTAGYNAGIEGDSTWHDFTQVGEDHKWEDGPINLPLDNSWHRDDCHVMLVDNLAKIPGITANKIDTFRDQVLTDEPPPPSQTAAFYLADSDSYLNKDVTVLVASVAQSDLSAPDSFRAVILDTANQNEPGGQIPALIPHEFYDSFIQYYQEPGRSFTGLLFQHHSNIVLVYSRK